MAGGIGIIFESLAEALIAEKGNEGGVQEEGEEEEVGAAQADVVELGGEGVIVSEFARIGV